MNDSTTNFWAERSEAYQELQWVKDDGFMAAFLRMAHLRPQDVVLDVGTGTGNVAKAVAPLVAEVVGIDTSPAMLGKASNGEYLIQDARAMEFADGTFDKVLARMVLHHITEGIGKALAECYRVLVPGGRIVVGEGTPPTAQFKEERGFVRDWYTSTFEMKEDRLTFDEYDLVKLLAEAGFKEIEMDSYTIEELSVRNWVENSGLSDHKQYEIMRRYQECPNYIEAAYHMIRTSNDWLIRCRHAIVTGIKPGLDRRPDIRREQMDRHLPDLFTEARKVLYVGASIYRADYLTEFAEAGCHVTVLDIWFPNVWHLASDGRVDSVIHGDVLDVDKLVGSDYDVAFWWHGPEHLKKEEAKKALGKLEKLAHLVIIGCPDGDYPLGASYGNPYEAHLSQWSAKDFEKLGYEAESLGGEPGTTECHILAWRET